MLTMREIEGDFIGESYFMYSKVLGNVPYRRIQWIVYVSRIEPLSPSTNSAHDYIHGNHRNAHHAGQEIDDS